MQPINQLLITIAKILEEILKETDQLSLQQSPIYINSKLHTKDCKIYQLQQCMLCSCIDIFRQSLRNAPRCSAQFKLYTQVQTCTSVLIYNSFYNGGNKNEYYAKVGGLSLKEINKLEMEFLDMLNYELFIQNEEFEIYEERLKQYEVIEI